MIKLNISIRIWIKIENKPKYLLEYCRISKNKNDLIATLILNTATMEKEWIINFKKDICEGPKYLNPLVELIVFKFGTNFFKVPEYELHKLAFEKIFLTSFFVRQL